MISLRSLVLLMLASTSIHAAESPIPTKVNWQDFRGDVYRIGDLFLAGQPLSQQAMNHLQAVGVTTIINLRTPEEMENRESTPIDEAARSHDLDISYHHLPSGGSSYPYSPQTVSQLAEILERSEGKVLLHCNSGRRATHLWVAYLVNHKGLEIDQAVNLGRAANFGSVPLEGYLGESATVQHLVPSN